MLEKILKNNQYYNFSTIDFQHINLFKTRSRVKIPQDSKTAIIFIFPYYNKKATLGNISAYCAVKDYHIEIMLQLKSICEQLQKTYPQHSFVPFVDASPIDEVDAAAKAGLGVVGKNSLLICPIYGSYVFIAEIITTLQIESVKTDKKSCVACNLCQKACPGGAIKNGKIQKEMCASYISQKKQELSDKETEILKKANTVFGCDICQKVCVHNREVDKCSQNLFSQDILCTVTRENIDNIHKQRAFGFRGAKVLHRNLTIYENGNLFDDKIL